MRIAVSVLVVASVAVGCDYDRELTIRGRVVAAPFAPDAAPRFMICKHSDQLKPGKPIPDVEIELASSLGERDAARTDDDGRFVVSLSRPLAGDAMDYLRVSSKTHKGLVFHNLAVGEGLIRLRNGNNLIVFELPPKACPPDHGPGSSEADADREE